MDLTWKEWLLVGLADVSLLFLFTLCSGREDRVSFRERCAAFCESIESEVLFCNPERKVAVCE